MKAINNMCYQLNEWIENPVNWFFVFQGKTFPPPSFEKQPGAFTIQTENVKVTGLVEMRSFGHIYKIVNISSDEYQLTEMPPSVIEAILDEIYSDGKQHLNPGMHILNATSEIPELLFNARWFPDNDYVQVLREKRGFMTEKEFEMIKPYLKQIYDAHGVGAPRFISDGTLIQVPDKVH